MEGEIALIRGGTGPSRADRGSTVSFGNSVAAMGGDELEAAARDHFAAQSG